MNSPPPPFRPSATQYVPAESLPPQRTNGPAIASLICGLLGCVPFVTGAVAIGLAFAGLRQARQPNVGGRSLAIAGLVLGILSLGGWLVVGGVVGAIYENARVPRATARDFLGDLSAANAAAAQARCVPAISSAEVAAAVNQVRPWGALNDVTFDSYRADSHSGAATHVRMSGRATYARGMHTVTFDLLKQGKTYQVSQFLIQ